MKRVARERWLAVCGVDYPACEDAEWRGEWALRCSSCFRNDRYSPFSCLTQATLPLCQLCKYATWHGTCWDADLRCTHPVDMVSENADAAWQGSDCWGFKPRCSFEGAVDALGLLLNGQEPDWEGVK